MDKNQEKLQEARANLEKLEKQIKADMLVNPGENDIYYKCMDGCYQMMIYLRQYVDSTNESLYNHTNPISSTHAPNLKTASQVEAYLKACKMSEDIEVVKPQIYVRASRQGKQEFVVDLNFK